MCGAEPPTQKKWKNHCGKRRASWFAHAMRCSCGTLNPFASLDSTAFWRGGPMYWGRSHIQPQSCHGYHFCYVLWGKYKVCRAVFVVKLLMLGFGFDMSERMSEDMSESMSKHMSERMSTDMSERMSEDRSEDMSERMSKNMSLADCFQSVCEIESLRTHFRRWVVCLLLPDPIRLT